MVDFVLFIPKAVLGQLLNKWLTLLEVGRLDSALCVTGCRQVFEDSLSRVYVQRSDLCACRSFVDWVIRYRVQLREATICGFLWNSASTRYAFLEVIGNSLKKLYVDRWNGDSAYASRPEMVLLDVSVHCTKLEELHVHVRHNREVCAVLARNPNIRVLCLTDCAEVLECIDRFCPSIVSVTELAPVMNVSMARFMDHPPKRVVKLHLPGCDFTKTELQHILVSCDRLRELSAGTLQSSIFAQIAQRSPNCGKNIAVLDTKYDTSPNVPVVAKDLRNIMPNLRVLTILPANEFTMRCNMYSLIKTLPELRRLICEYPCCTALTKFGSPPPIPSRSRPVSSLRELFLSARDVSSPDQLARMLSLCSSLHTIGFDEIPYAETLGLCAASGVRNIFISDFGDVDEASIRPISNLRGFCVHGFSKFEDSALISLAQRCPELAVLELSHAPRITHRAALQVLELCPRLHTLTLGHCTCKGIPSNVGSQTAQLLRKVCLKKYPCLKQVWLCFDA